jgi:hypothetical protein
MNEEGDDFNGVISVWDIIALFAHLVKNLFASFEEFFSVLSHMALHKANVVEDQKLFHDDVVRTIETIIEGE